MLDQAVEEVFGLMNDAHQRGSEVEFTFAFAGHGRGSADDGGAVFLADGPLTRTELTQRVVQRSPADFNHLIIDACDSYFMISARGTESYPDDRVTDADTERLVASYFSGDGPASDPRTGFLVSTNQTALSHEHDAYRAGIFSHIVRSALVGAADTNGDGRIEYTEVMAYAAAASQEISDPRARLSIYGRAPPRDVHRPLVDFSSSTFAHYLRLDGDLEGRLHIEDGRSIRYADLHKTRGTELLLALVDGPVYSVYRGDDEARVVLAERGAVRLGRLTLRRTLSRGQPEERLATELFATPFDPSYFSGFVASRGLPSVARGPRFNPPEAARATFLPGRPRFLFAIPGLGLVATGGLLGGAAGGATLATKFFFDQYIEALRTTGQADIDQERRINTLRVLTGLFVAAGVGFLAAGGILIAVELLWPARTGGRP
jgi:hypothetical protein